MRKILSTLFLLSLLSLVTFAADYNGYIVKIKENTLENIQGVSLFSDRAMLFSDMDDSDVVELLADELADVSEINSEHMLVKAVDEASLQELIDLGVVEYYEENLYAYLYGYNYSANTLYDSNQKWYFDAVNLGFAWDAGIYGSDTKVAVIDSGVYLHNDIKNNIVPGINYVAGESADNTTDVKGHGTAVAGLIASQCNSIGVVGGAFKTKVVPLKVTNNTSVELANIVDAVYDAVDEYNCDVINMSFGMSSDTESLQNAVNHAINKNVIVVAAAGNEGNTGYKYPASYDGVISVANAEKYSGSFRIYSSSQKNDKVDIAAPGKDLTSLVNSADGYDKFVGTSFSAPIVSAVAALAKSVKPSISPYEFERLVRLTADSSYMSFSGQDSNAWGMGMLDVKALFKELLGDDCYVSKKATVSDNTFVYITNFSDEAVKNGTIVVSEYDESGALTSVENIPLSLGSYESYEFSLTENGFSENARVEFVGKTTPGDVDGDGNVSLRDASVIMRYLAGYVVTATESAMDVDGDNSVTLRDASAILRHLAGYTVNLK